MFRKRIILMNIRYKVGNIWHRDNRVNNNNNFHNLIVRTGKRIVHLVFLYKIMKQKRSEKMQVKYPEENKLKIDLILTYIYKFILYYKS